MPAGRVPGRLCRRPPQLGRNASGQVGLRPRDGIDSFRFWPSRARSRHASRGSSASSARPSRARCRRSKETIGDLDFLAVSRQPAEVMRFFVEMPEVTAVHAQGESKSMVRLANGMDADLRVVPAQSFGAALAYFTGSRDHNVALRRMAQEKGLKLNEYGLFRGERAIARRTEEEVYEALGLPWIPRAPREPGRDRGGPRGCAAGARGPRLAARRPPGADELERRRGLDRRNGTRGPGARP